MTPPADTLRARVTGGLAWKATSSVVLQLIRIGVAVLLARLLSPHDYGVAGMVVVFSSLVLIFSDLAFGAALVQRESVTEEDRSTVFWTSAGVGLVLMLVGIALSGPIASFYGEPRVQPLFAAMSVSFLITAVSSTQAALLTREMNFRSLELRQIGAGVASGAAGLTLAFAGYGPWAIIGQQVVAAAASTMLLWVASPWRPTFRFSIHSLRSMANYSGNVFGSRLLFYANRNADNLLIGRFLGASALGTYSVGYNLMLLPMSNVSTPVQDVLFPAFSRLQHDLRSMKDGWFRANRVVVAITAPALAGLAAIAPDFVHVVLGEKWSAAGTVIRILAFVGLLQSVQSLNSTVLRAVDRTDVLLRYSIVVLIASLSAFVVGLSWGVVGVAAAYAVSSCVVEPYYSWLTARAAGIGLADFMRPLVGVGEAVFGMTVLVVLARAGLTEAGLSAAARFPIIILVGILVYVPLCAWRAPELREEIRGVRRHRRARRAALGRALVAEHS